MYIAGQDGEEDNVVCYFHECLCTQLTPCVVPKSSLLVNVHSYRLDHV